MGCNLREDECVMVAEAYNTYAHSYNSLVTTIEEDLDVIFFYCDQSCGLDILLETGLLEVWGTFNNETIAWTVVVHCNLRPWLCDGWL